MASSNKPRYQQLKDAIIDQISVGELRIGDRVPSENDLVHTMRVSRMTANRALRELTDEGYVKRVAGRGTFVSDVRAQSHVREVQNIADEIAARGRTHTSRVVMQDRDTASADVARALHLKKGASIFHLQLVHAENGHPIQFEDRFIRTSFAPKILEQSFADITPSGYLTWIAPLQEAEQLVRAELPDKNIRKRLNMTAAEPVLVVIRRTWANGRPVTFARLSHPGSRYELTGHYQPPGKQQLSTDNII